MSQARKRKRVSVDMTAVPAAIRAGENAGLTGRVFVNGRPASRIVVVFATADAALGAVIPGLTVTDCNGNFTATFRSFRNEGQPVFRAESVVAALPSFPGVTTASTIAIITQRRL